MICVSIKAGTTAEAARLLKRARVEGADLAEVRADFIDDLDVEALLKDKPLPVIFTLRPAWEGGEWRKGEDLRVMTLREAAERGADYVDVEFKAFKDIPGVEAKLIVSYHDFEGMPKDLAGVVSKMSQLKPFLVKLACTPRSTAELLALAQIRTPGLKAVTAMGEFAEPLRALYGRLGSFMTYAAFGHDVATAPGQMSLKEMREVYRAHEVDETWAAFAVVGNPVRHSKGPHLWNHAFRALGMRAVYCRIPLDDADLLPEVIRTFALSGVSVTVPHKSAVMRHMAELDETAERIGAVNTVAAREGKLRGTNTDWIGAVGAIEEGCRRKFGSGTLGKKALVFGAGGTGRAVVYGLAEAGAEVILTNRDWDRASDVAQEFGVKVVPIEAVEEVVDPEIVVNATSVGMAPDADRSVVPPSLLRPDQVCMDVVYAPRETRFLREAAEAGAECVPGERMFILQAAAQFRELTGREVPAEVQEAWTRMVQE